MPAFKYADLNSISVDTKVPLIELEILLTHILNIDRFLLKAYPEKTVNPKQAAKFFKLLTQRINKVPLAYIINKTSFWDLDLIINQHVLVPRSSTEVLVMQALNILSVDSKAKILELGTGSGAISLALAKHRPFTNIIALDISKQALKIAEINAKNLNIINIKFIYSDWFKHSYFSCYPKFDMIISNPPYIAENEKFLCDQEIFFEPAIALFAKEQGLHCLKHIIDNSPYYLAKHGFLLLEHGFKQQSLVVATLKNTGFVTIDAFSDLENFDRVVVARL